MNVLCCRLFKCKLTIDRALYVIEKSRVGGLPLLKTTAAQSMLFCQIPGVSLSDHQIENQAAASTGQCALRCAEHMDCLSADFDPSTSTCQLNDITDVGHEFDLVVNQSTASLIHLTSRSCN